MFSSTSVVTGTSSSLFSTVAPTAPGTQESLKTDKTVMSTLTPESSVSPVSDGSSTSSITVTVSTSQGEEDSVTPEKSSVSPTTGEESSGDRTPDMFSSTSVVTGTSSSLFSTVAPTAPGTQESLETSTILMTTSPEGSGDDTTEFTTESVFTASIVPSLLTTKSPSVTASRAFETSETSSATVTRVSSLYSTDRPTSQSPETQETVTTSQAQTDSVTSEKSSVFPTTGEESSGEQTTDISTEHTAAPTASSMFSTEKPTALAIEEQYSAVTVQTEKSSHPTETFSVATVIDAEGSGDRTPDMFSSTSVVTGTSSSLFSTVAPTAPGTQESLKTDKTVMSTLTPESSVLQFLMDHQQAQ
ncbi:mucin-3A-like isoform X2 [Hippoglossus hippoglossus]|uniref:mucin-3A-like isoform X2 n=1 Tax=Hippoglossus hippoglossus TaxID=8267 RepID=UPI00148CC924|nr:mucin-3A-like isoform X2 [Hippoglossus hippoglossus]